MKMGALGLLVAAVIIATCGQSMAADFQTKCQGPGVLGCWGFDSPSQLFYIWPVGTVCAASFAGQPSYAFSLDRSGPGNTAAIVQNGRCVFPVVRISAF